jgi:hypothetical protein
MSDDLKGLHSQGQYTRRRGRATHESEGLGRGRGRSKDVASTASTKCAGLLKGEDRKDDLLEN